MTNENTTLILSPFQIQLKIQRMAYQIWEQHAQETELMIIGIADNGYVLAELLVAQLAKICTIKVRLVRLAFNKTTPLSDLPKIDVDLNGKSVLLVDDVANSGKVLLYALKPILEYTPARITMAVLVDRKHKAYPIRPNIIGYSLSTTLKEHIRVESDGTQISGVYLE